MSSIRATGDVPQHLSTLGNRLYRNNNGVFEDVSYDSGITAGGWGWGSCFLDIDNDGDLDIYQTNGWPEWDELGPFSSDATRVFVNQGNGIFHETAGELGLSDEEQGRGVVCADFDRDGDLDILVGREDGTLDLLRNEGSKENPDWQMAEVRFAKIDIGIAKGKKKEDKRESIKLRDWNRQKSRIMKENN